MRDVQKIIDENYLNYLLFGLFYGDKPFSLSEKLFSILPDALIGGS